MQIYSEIIAAAGRTLSTVLRVIVSLSVLVLSVSACTLDQSSRNYSPGAQSRPGISSQLPVTGALGLDHDREILKNYLKVGNNRFDRTRAQNLQSLLVADAIQIELQRVSGMRAGATGRIHLADIVQRREFAGVRKLLVEEARRRGWIP